MFVDSSTISMPDDTPSRHVPLLAISPQVGSAGVALVRSDGLPVGKIAGIAVSPTKNGDQKWGPKMGTTYDWEWYTYHL